MAFGQYPLGGRPFGGLLAVADSPVRTILSLVELTVRPVNNGDLMHARTYAHVGEYGFTFEVDAGREVKDVSWAEVLLKRPDGTVFSMEAEVLDDDRFWGFAVADTEPAVLNQAGEWSAQLQLMTPSGPYIGTAYPFLIGPTLAVTE